MGNANLRWEHRGEGRGREGVGPAQCMLACRLGAGVWEGTGPNPSVEHDEGQGSSGEEAREGRRTCGKKSEERGKVRPRGKMRASLSKASPLRTRQRLGWEWGQSSGGER